MKKDEIADLYYLKLLFEDKELFSRFLQTKIIKQYPATPTKKENKQQHTQPHSSLHMLSATYFTSFFYMCTCLLVQSPQRPAHSRHQLQGVFQWRYGIYMHNNLLAKTHLNLTLHILPNFCVETEGNSEVVRTSKKINLKDFILNMDKRVVKGTLIVLISCAPPIKITWYLQYSKL